MMPKMTDTDVTKHIEGYFQSQRAIIDQACDSTVPADARLKLIQTLVHNSYREGMQFSTGLFLGNITLTGGKTDDKG